LDFRNAALERGKRYSVTTRIGETTQTYAANAIGRTQLVLNTGKNAELHQALADGETMTVSLDGTAGIYKLQGSKRAFFEFEHCVKALAPTYIKPDVVTASAVPVEKIVTEIVPPPAPKNEPVAPVQTAKTETSSFSLANSAHAAEPEYAPAPVAVLVAARQSAPVILFEPAPALIVDKNAPAPLPKPVQEDKFAEEPMTLALPEIEPAAAEEK